MRQSSLAHPPSLALVAPCASPARQKAREIVRLSLLACPSSVVARRLDCSRELVDGWASGKSVPNLLRILEAPPVFALRIVALTREAIDLRPLVQRDPHEACGKAGWQAKQTNERAARVLLGAIEQAGGRLRQQNISGACTLLECEQQQAIGQLVMEGAILFQGDRLGWGDLVLADERKPLTGEQIDARALAAFPRPEKKVHQNHLKNARGLVSDLHLPVAAIRESLARLVAAGSIEEAEAPRHYSEVGPWYRRPAEGADKSPKASTKKTKGKAKGKAAPKRPPARRPRKADQTATSSPTASVEADEPPPEEPLPWQDTAAAVAAAPDTSDGAAPGEGAVH